MTASTRSFLALLIVALSSGGAARGPAAPPEVPEPPRAAAAAVFQRFRSLAGEWDAASTKGWTETIRYQTIAGGSVVLETSVGAHPGETMATTFQMDGEKLLLTHYCVAGNTPRLEATGFSEDGRTVTFSFRDGVNLADRDRGHMDAAVFIFESGDRVRSRWSWYENGAERWMEEIVQTRRPSPR